MSGLEVVYGHFWLVLCGICFLVLHEHLLLPRGKKWEKVAPSITGFFAQIFFVSMDHTMDHTYGVTMDDLDCMPPLEAKVGIKTFAGPAGVVFDTIRPPLGAAGMLPALPPDHFQTELQMNGDDNHGSCLKNLNKEQVVECSPDPISMVQMVVQMEATIGNKTLEDQPLDPRYLRPSDDIDRNKIQEKVKSLRSQDYTCSN